MKRILLFCLLCLLWLCIFSSATSSHIVQQKSFPQEHRLTSERFPLTREPLHMELKEDFLIICTRNALQIHSASDYSFVQAIGDEMQQPDAMLQILRSSSPFLYTMDVNRKNEMRKYRLNSSGHSVLLQSGFTGVTSSMNRPYILRDSLIVYDEFFPEASIKIHNLYTNKLARTLPYGATSLNDRFFDKNMGGLYANDSCIVFAYKYQNRIDFYDWQLNLRRSVNRQHSNPIINQQNRINNILYYGHSFMGQNYFYTLFRGVSHKVFRTDSLLNRSGRSYIYGLTRDILEVYDMDGLLVCRFHFDDIAPAIFVVDEKRNRLLGYREVYPDSLLVYQLKGLPKNGKELRESVQPVSFSLPVILEPNTIEETTYFTTIEGRRDIAPTYFIRYGSIFVIVTEASGIQSR